MKPARTPLRVIVGWLGFADRAVVATFAALGGLVASVSGAPVGAASLYALLGACCAAIMLIDFRHYLIPDFLSLPLLPAGLLVVVMADDPVAPRVAAVAGLWLSLRLFASLAYRVKGVDAFGQGDVKLISVAGAWLSADAIATFIVVSASAAVALHLFRNHFRESARESRVPFGSTLAPVLLIMALLDLVIRP